MNHRQKAYLTSAVIVNAALWAVPSNVLELIARGRDVLLGRYSREHMALNLAVLIVSLVLFYIDRATGEAYKRRWFQVVAIAMFLFPCLVAVDWFARRETAAHYVRDTAAYHRPPNIHFSHEFSDRPQAKRSYPDAPAGFGAVGCDYTTDSRGFRNRSEQSQSEIVVLGDSFAEGSKVSDNDAWPARLAGHVEGSVYNLGMSGYSPIEYLASLRTFGTGLRPKVVVCSIYEGNDFREAEADVDAGRDSIWDRLNRYAKQSPLREAVDRLLISTLGGVGASSPVDGIEMLSWMPVAAPAGPAAKYYAFDPKDLLDAARTSEAFAADRRWRTTAEMLDGIAKECLDLGAALVVVFVPSKVHVVLPIVRDSLPAEKVRAFAALAKSKLPPADAFMEHVFANLATRQNAVADWCRSAGVAFIALTDPLRAETAAGNQVYYTYDQHWTPDGHRVVAGVIADRLISMGIAAATGEPSEQSPAAFTGSKDD